MVSADYRKQRVHCAHFGVTVGAKIVEEARFLHQGNTDTTMVSLQWRQVVVCDGWIPSDHRAKHQPNLFLVAMIKALLHPEWSISWQIAARRHVKTEPLTTYSPLFTFLACQVESNVDLKNDKEPKIGINLAMKATHIRYQGEERGRDIHCMLDIVIRVVLVL